MYSRILRFAVAVAISFPLWLVGAQAPVLVLRNRVLASVHGKTISALDLMKHMDFFLTTHYPEAMEVPLTRYEFYASNWKASLQGLIDAKLILADAEGKDLHISEGDIREAVIEKFGPHVIATLDKLGISYEEAHRMTHEEMIVQRMTFFKVQAKALQEVTPQEVKDAYTTYLQDAPVEETWKYHVVSVRGEDLALTEEVARTAYDLLSCAKENLATLPQKLAELYDTEHRIALHVSQEMTTDAKSISDTHRAALAELTPGNFSTPQLQKSCARDGTEITVRRIFYLKDHAIKMPPSFEHTAATLQEELLNAAAAREDALYKTKLRRRFGFAIAHVDRVPPDFQPYTLVYP